MNISSSEWNDLNVEVASLRRDTANTYQQILVLSEVMLKQESFMKDLRKHFDLEKTEINPNNSDDDGSIKTSKTEKTCRSVFQPKVKLTLKEFTEKADAFFPTYINQVLVSYHDLRAIQYNK